MLSIAKTTPEILASSLKAGKIISFQTDTLFSLSADATNNIAVDKIYQIKARDLNKPLPIFVNSIEMAEEIAIFSPLAKKIALRYWPGALTIVLPIKSPSMLSEKIYANSNSIAIRIPKAKTILDTIDILKHPITATSANISNTPNTTDIKEILSLNAQIECLIMLDSPQPTTFFTPSTIIKIIGDKLDILREGAIGADDMHQHL